MKILSWNVRGLGQSRTSQARGWNLYGEDVGLRMVLMLRRQDQGGLSLGWMEGINITLKSYSKSHIDVVVEEEDGAKNWRFTGFYEEPVEQNRRASWELLRALKNGNNLPWLVAGILTKFCFPLKNKEDELERKGRWMHSEKHWMIVNLPIWAFPGNGIRGKEAGLLVIILEKDLIEVLQIQGGGNCFQILKFVIYNTVFHIIAHW
ncbi:reverse transcriptase [Gossypium australe]|uniref:Reverse transcriptase n=1 Tax=Gossypium australe TaxID=47621 RepID=A0A5B6WKM8_9ROSI|nr:reverse transcriptase [Gossypium australe]